VAFGTVNYESQTDGLALEAAQARIVLPHPFQRVREGRWFKDSFLMG
jgi:hypothetical protein